MIDLKESATIQSQSAILGVQEGILSVLNAYHAMSPVKRAVVLFLIITIIPAYLGVRYGSEKILSTQYARVALSAHPSYSVTQPPMISAVKLIRNPSGLYSAYAEVTNLNLDLSATDIPYTINFTNKAGETVSSITNTLYLLPNERKYLVIPRIESNDAPLAGTIKLGEINWEKRLSLPEVELRVSEPTLTEEYNPLTFAAEGSVVNNSPYELQSVRLVFFLYDANDMIVGISQRDEFRLSAFGRRAYKQLWPGLYKANIKKVHVEAYTNTLDPQNITVESKATPTVADPRDKRPF